MFVSSISVYDDANEENFEDSPMKPLPDGASQTEMTPDTYGPLKALCERVVTGAFRERATIVRPGLIVGPFDRTDRFTYWPVRFARGGEILAPGLPGGAGAVRRRARSRGVHGALDRARCRAATTTSPRRKSVHDGRRHGGLRARGARPAHRAMGRRTSSSPPKASRHGWICRCGFPRAKTCPAS